MQSGIAGGISDDLWHELSDWSREFHGRDYRAANSRLELILDRSDSIALLAQASFIGSFLVERIHQDDNSRSEVALLLFELVAPSVKYWALDGGYSIPDEELVQFFAAPSSFAPPGIPGEKSDRWVYITIGACLSLYDGGLRNEADVAYRLAVERQSRG